MKKTKGKIQVKKGKLEKNQVRKGKAPKNQVRKKLAKIQLQKEKN